MPNYYRISDPSDVRDLGNQMAAWVAAGNPKADDWAVQPAAPSPDAVWQDGVWIVPPAPTFTAAEWVDLQKFDGNRPTTLLYLKLQLDAADKSSPKLAAVQAWLDQLIVAGVTAPEERRNDWPASPWSFEEASAEAVQDLAVKTGGLNAAAQILPVAQTIEQQLTAVSDPSVPFAEGPCRQASAV